MTITLAIHPLAGKKLQVVAVVREQGRPRYVHVELPDRRTLRVPIEWTDRAEPRAVPLCDGREVRLCARGLLELSRAVAAALDREAAPPKMDTVAGAPRQLAPRPGSGEGGKKASGARGVGEDAARAPARRARGVGDAHPEDPPRARRHRRGKP